MADGSALSGTPADVAALFRWANLAVLPYRDFTDERREYRAGVRRRAALLRRDAEAAAKAAAERAAEDAERAARSALERARRHASEGVRATERQKPAEVEREEAARERALVEAEQWSRKAAAERMEAARRAEALRAAEQAARRELPAVHAALTRPKPLRLSQSVSPPERLLVAAAPQHTSVHQAMNASPRELRPVAVMEQEYPASTGDMNPVRIPGRRSQQVQSSLRNRSAEAASVQPAAEEQLTAVLAETPGPEAFRYTLDPDAAEHAVDAYSQTQPYRNGEDGELAGLAEARPSAAQRDDKHPDAAPDETAAPSWIGSDTPVRIPSAPGRSPLRETLQHSKEKVASRWFALRGIFQGADPEAEADDDTQLEEDAPILAIFSVAGGVGKTSLAASLARALAAQGERVLLADMTGRGVLPFYFGGRGAQNDAPRTFAPPAGNADQPITLLTRAVATQELSEPETASPVAQILQERRGFSRVLVDLDAGATDLLQELVALGADVLVPVAPDMNSVISLGPVRRALARALGTRSGAGAQAFFALVQFEPSQALQLDIREILQQQLREQLLPYTIRRSTLIAEALAEGMTVIDYAPGEAVAKDYMQLAAWVRTLAQPAREGLAQARWSER